MKTKYLSILALPFVLASCGSEKTVIEGITPSFCNSLSKTFVDQMIDEIEKPAPSEEGEEVENFVVLRFYSPEVVTINDVDYNFVVFSCYDDSNDGAVETIGGINFNYANSHTNGYLYDGSNFSTLRLHFMLADFTKEDVETVSNVYETGIYHLNYRYNF